MAPSISALWLIVNQAFARSAFKPPPVVRGSTYLALGGERGDGDETGELCVKQT